LRGRALLIIGDNQGACSCLEKLFAPSADGHAFIVRIWAFALANGIQLYFRWQPRESVEMFIADLHSKVADPSAWALRRDVVETIFARCESVAGERPSLDASADNLNTCCPVFISKEICPGAGYTDMFAHGGVMALSLCYINGDFSRMNDILRIIRKCPCSFNPPSSRPTLTSAPRAFGSALRARVRRGTAFGTLASGGE
jgi:hypothetical protein